MKKIADLARETGVSMPTVYHWVRYRRCIPAPDIQVGLRMQYSPKQYTDALEAVRKLRS